MLKENFFDVFGLPVRFTLESTELDAAYRKIQAHVHPDKFATATDVEKRVAMQWATRVNEAYQTLKSPLSRARYLCELHGVDLQVESNTSMPAAFLTQQMAWREEWHDAQAHHDEPKLQQIKENLASLKHQEITVLTQLLDEHQDFVAAADALRRLMFIDKALSDMH